MIHHKIIAAYGGVDICSYAFPVFETAESVMGDVINLNKRRKHAERKQAAAIADVNRTRFGRTIAERDLSKQKIMRDMRLLDQHRIDGEDAS